MKMMIKLIYITVPDKALASGVAKILVQEKLAACVNILGPLESFYMWENELTQGNEVLLLAKTNVNLEADLIKRVKELHPFECPCIISFDIHNGEPNFLEWVNSF
jgi:periplasmic divalent cation tolerance protein